MMTKEQVRIALSDAVETYQQKGDLGRARLVREVWLTVEPLFGHISISDEDRRALDRVGVFTPRCDNA